MNGKRPMRALARHKRSRASRRGLTLLEVMVALAILTASIAVTSELVRVGSRNAAGARDLTTAQLLCENKMAEIIVGIQPLKSTSRTTLPEDPRWLYSITTMQTQQEGLLAVEVLVEKNSPQTTPSVRRPVFYRLVRWIIDPEVEASLAEAAAEQQEAANAIEEESTEDAL